MNYAYRAVVCFSMLFLLSSPSHAEGNCPPGYYPIGGQGVQGCAPLPNYEQQQPMDAPAAAPPRWKSRWGAIALDEGVTNVGLGVSTNAESSGQAKKNALSDCKAKGGTGCKIQITYRDQCAAVIAGIHYSRSQGASTIHEAENIGLKACRDANVDGCSVYYSACSLPLQAQ